MVEPPRFLAATPGGEKIERLGESDGHSGVDELLRTARLRSSVWCRSELSVPWSFAVRARDAASFHLVLDGAGWLAVEGDGTQRLLATGDLVVLPHGDAHALRDDPSSPLVFLDDLLARSKPVDGRLVHGGGGARTEILCGGLVFEGAAATPLLASLPSVVHVRGADGRPPAALASTLELIRHELAGVAPGTELVVTRLTDVLLAQALRIFLGTRNDVGSLADPLVAAAIRHVYERPEHPWTVAELASRVALSRSAFSGRFRRATGDAPMRYVGRVRLTRAAEYLHGTSASLMEIARLCGYGSDVSLSKAFKRTFGVSPGRYRNES